MHVGQSVAKGIVLSLPSAVSLGVFWLEILPHAHGAHQVIFRGGDWLMLSFLAAIPVLWGAILLALRKERTRRDPWKTQLAMAWGVGIFVLSLSGLIAVIAG